jgi:hypothetical protein
MRYYLNASDFSWDKGITLSFFFPLPFGTHGSSIQRDAQAISAVLILSTW